MKKLTKAIASSLIVASVIALNPIGASASWRQDSNGWWNTEGSSWSKGWKEIDGKWYYFKQDGYMAHDTTIDGYSLNSNGVSTTSYTGSSTTSAVPDTQSQTIYSEPATGDMDGWQKLRGHEYEGIAEIYYKLNGSIQNVQVKDIRTFDLNKVVEWIDDNGTKRSNTLREIYYLFTYSNTYTTDWFSNKFGSIYGDWLLVSSIKADDIVSAYLERTGQIQKQSHVTLTPDAVVETKDNDNEDISNENAIKNIEKRIETLSIKAII